MKHHIGVTIDSKLLRETETLRAREKRRTFINTSLNSDSKPTKKKKLKNPTFPSKKEDNQSPICILIKSRKRCCRLVEQVGKNVY